MPPSHHFGSRSAARGDTYGMQPCLLVCHKMALIHNEPGTDAPDAVVALCREVRQVVEIEIQWLGHGVLCDGGRGIGG